MAGLGPAGRRCRLLWRRRPDGRPFMIAPSKVLVHALGLHRRAADEKCVRDIEHLRAPAELGGCSSPPWTICIARCGCLGFARSGASRFWLLWPLCAATVWERRGDAAAPWLGWFLDIDSTLVEVHSDEQVLGAPAHFKAGFGFHPMLCATSA